MSPACDLITTRHEQGAAHMADGYARASRKPGIVMVVPGAALYNAASGLYNGVRPIGRRCSPLPPKSPGARSAKTLGPFMRS